MLELIYNKNNKSTRLFCLDTFSISKKEEK